MLTNVLVPQMGESVLEGTILEWKVKVGDHVVLNQPLVELMTDKVNVEIPAESAGVVTAIFAKTGEVVPVGTRIATIEESGSGTATVTPVVVEAAPKVESKSAQPVKKDVVEIKPTAEAGRGKMSPKVRMMAREYGIDPSTIIPTGKDGLVTQEDVMRMVEARSSGAGLAPATPSQPAQTKAVTVETSEPKIKIQVPAFAPLSEDKRVTRMPLIGARKMISDHMVKSIQTSAHVTTFEDIDLTELTRFRTENKKEFFETYGANLTYMPFIMKACCVALKDYPTINASMTDKEIILKNYFNIGVAVARDEGLIVPVVKDADKKSIIELAVEIQQLGEKARTNRLKPDDVADGTFTLTNAGMFGATASTPIINQPQVAILGIHQIVKKPWVVKDQIVIRDMSTFGMSFDHRLIDGHTAVKFLHQVNLFLSDPTKLSLNLR